MKLPRINAETVGRFFDAMWRAFRYWVRGRPVVAPRFERVNRMAHCRGCPHNDSGICAKCDCLIDAKVMLSSEECPDHPPRWLAL